MEVFGFNILFNTSSLALICNIQYIVFTCGAFYGISYEVEVLYIILLVMVTNAIVFVQH